MTTQKRPTVWIVSLGEEIVRGELVDTNASWLAEKMEQLGFSVMRHISSGDLEDEIVEVLQSALNHAQVVLCTGGLGPTSDDRTAAAAAGMAGVSLERHPEAQQWVENILNMFNLSSAAEQNFKQADLPKGSVPLFNPAGTAPGFHLDYQGTAFFFLPGVPREMKVMFKESVKPEIEKAFPDVQSRTIRKLSFFGTGESKIAQTITDLEEKYDTVSFRYRASFPVITLTLHEENNSDRSSALDDLAEEIKNRLGKYLFSSTGISLPETVINLLRDNKQTLALAESCTGGLVAKLITDIPGSSDVFNQGIVAYANEVKSRLLAVPNDIIEIKGAVSEEVALHMALGARKTSGSSIGIGITGIAGPGGGTPEKPVGTVWIAIAHPDGERAITRTLPRDREGVRLLTAHMALEMVRRYLLGM